jgi:hypothetical protein
MKSLAPLIASLLIGGCGHETVRWYQPEGSGTLDSRSCGGPQDIFRLALDQQGSYMQAGVLVPKGRIADKWLDTPMLTYGIQVAPKTKIRVTEPVFIVRSEPGREIGRHPLARLSGPNFRSKPITEELDAPADRLDRGDSFYTASISVKSLPERFEVRYPTLMVNGQRVEGPGVRYALTERGFLLRRCLF